MTACKTMEIREIPRADFIVPPSDNWNECDSIGTTTEMSQLAVHPLKCLARRLELFRKGESRFVLGLRCLFVAQFFNGGPQEVVDLEGWRLFHFLAGIQVRRKPPDGFLQVALRIYQDFTSIYKRIGTVQRSWTDMYKGLLHLVVPLTMTVKQSQV